MSWTQGNDYKLLSVKDGGGKWRMETLRPQTIYFENEIIPPNQIRTFYDKLGCVWLTMYPRKMVLSRGYRWNGNTPKRGFRFLWRDWWFGTLDFFPGTAASSGWHDALFQFSGLIEMPFNLNEANVVYHQLAEAHGAPMDEVYNLVLKVCSSRSWGKSETGLFCRITNITP